MSASGTRRCANAGEFTTSAEQDFIVGEWTVAPTRNLLARGDVRVHLEPRAMDVLVYLARRRGDVVSRSELLERVWRVQYLSSDALIVTIYALRKALGDDARRPKYIETIPRRGYRWIGPVISVVQDRTRRLRQRRVIHVSLAAMLVISSVVALRTRSRPQRHILLEAAHAADVKGRYFLDQRSNQSWHQALDQFALAALTDSLDPVAQAGLADTYAAMAELGVVEPALLRQRAMRAAQRAVDLDAASGVGYEAMGRAQLLFDWDFAAAERNLNRALALSPDYVPAYQGMAWVLSARGHHAGALAAAQRAVDLDPTNVVRYIELSWVLAIGSRYRDALQVIDRALDLDPRSVPTLIMRAWVNELSGQPQAAFAGYRNALQIAGATPGTLHRLDALYGAHGLAAVHRDWLDRQAQSGAGPVCETWRAQLYAQAGQPDSAVQALERAYKRREGALAWVNVEPAFRLLRSNGGFREVAARVLRESSVFP